MKESFEILLERAAIEIAEFVVNVLSDEMLQKALDKAISEENYEQASHLLEEQRRRERKEHKS